MNPQTRKRISAAWTDEDKQEHGAKMRAYFADPARRTEHGAKIRAGLARRKAAKA